MNPLPSAEERQWIADALKKLLAKRGAELIDAAPLVEPTNTWFPEGWSATARHGHRLAQRLLFYAGLKSLKPTLSAYEPMEDMDGELPLDAGTAGWFAGIEDGRAYFGLHVRQFSDPEAAAGVLAHEVAHAWRTHHRLTVDDHDEEELLTDLTTIVLGFGILSTNNTDRYRSSGTWSETVWSISSGGYLPPQAMSYALALWCSARGKRGEQKAIEKHLEPNQGAFFRAALAEIENARELLTTRAPSSVMESVRREAFTPYEPSDDELAEPEYEAAEEVNRGQPVYRIAKGSAGSHAYIGAIAGFVFGGIAGLILFREEAIEKVGIFAAICSAALALFMIMRSRKSVCSECGEEADDNVAVCKGCGGSLGRRVTEKEMQRIREEELDRLTARDIPYEECDVCTPERACAKHGDAEEFDDDGGAGEDACGPAGGEASAPRDDVRGARLLRAIAMLVVLALGGAAVMAWWRQTHVPVYFDNALNRPLTLTLDGKQMPFRGRLAVRVQLKPGRHSIVVSEGPREIERFDANISRQSLLDALMKPRFFVYNTSGAGIYERVRLVYSTKEWEQTYDSQYLSLERWLEEPMVNYLFVEPPLEVSSAKATKTAFRIAKLIGTRELAWAWFQEGKREQAMLAVKKGLESHPCRDDLRNDTVDLLLAADDVERAKSEAMAWVSACDGSIAAHRVFQNVTRENMAALREQYRARLEQSPIAANHYLYGRLLDGPPALEKFREALRIDPELTHARVALGHELLAAEEDLQAYETLNEALGHEDLPQTAPIYYAMAAVAAGKIDQAIARVSNAPYVDPAGAWQASFLLARAKRDWGAAKILLAQREEGEPTTETKLLRAGIAWDEGGVRESILTDLHNDPDTAEGAKLLELEDAFEHGRFAEAAARTDLPELFAVYASHAGVLAKAAARVEIKNPFCAALVDAAHGRIDEKTLLARAAENDVTMWTHAWFALGVRAAAAGDRERAARFFHKSADRAFDRQFPYDVALAMAQRYE